MAFLRSNSEVPFASQIWGKVYSTFPTGRVTNLRQQWLSIQDQRSFRVRSSVSVVDVWSGAFNILGFAFPMLILTDQSSVRILKEFKDESEFWAEHTAFTTLIKDGRSPEHIIEYLGSYEQGDVRCIILEFADRGSLDEYFNGTIAPKSEEDIIRFYTSLFKLLRGLMSIHEVGEDIVGYEAIRISCYTLR